MEKSSLTALARELMVSAKTKNSGRSARTVYGGHERILRQTVVALTAGSSLDEHDNPGEATVQVLSGRIVLKTDGVEWEGSLATIWWCRWRATVSTPWKIPRFC